MPSPSSWHSFGLPTLKMTSFDTYNAKTTSISFPWPASVTGVERIALSAQGDLQRVLSAFFSRPIVIALVYSHTLRQRSLSTAPEPLTLPNPQAVASASPASPITQTRQVHLQCGGKIACTATSIVRITSPEIAHLFLEEKYAIGQMFRRLEKVPAFELLSVGTGPVIDEDGQFCVSQGKTASSTGDQLWRKYKLTIPHFECQILEVFPSRWMFEDGEAWINGETQARPPGSKGAPEAPEINITLRLSRIQHGFALILLLACILTLTCEGVLMYFGRPINCSAWSNV